MAKIIHWDVHVPCPRWVKTRETNQFESDDCIYFNHISTESLSQLPKHVQETYEECPGEVNVQGHSDVGRVYGHPHCLHPSIGEEHYGLCSEWVMTEWELDEEDRLSQAVANKELTDG